MHQSDQQRLLRNELRLQQKDTAADRSDPLLSHTTTPNTGLCLAGTEQRHTRHPGRQAKQQLLGTGLGQKGDVSAPHRYSAYFSGHPNAMMVLSGHHSTHRWITT